MLGAGIGGISAAYELRSVIGGAAEIGFDAIGARRLRPERNAVELRDGRVPCRHPVTERGQVDGLLF